MKRKTICLALILIMAINISAFAIGTETAPRRIFEMDLQSLNVEMGTNLPITDASQIGAVESSGLNVNILDPNNAYPVLYPANGEGYAIFKLDAYQGRTFKKIELNLQGRTFGTDELGHSVIDVLVGTEQGDVTTSIASYSSNAVPMNLDKKETIELSDGLEGLSTVYVKLALKCKNEQNWACLSGFYINAVYTGEDYNDNKQTYEMFSTNFDNLGVEAGKITDVSSPAMINAVGAEQMNLAILDSNNLYPVLFSNAGSGYVIYEVNSIGGKIFNDINLKLFGRTFGQDALGHTSLTLKVGDSPLSVNTVLKEYSSRGTALALGEEQTIPIEFAKGKDKFYLKVEFEGVPGQTWSCIKYLKISGTLLNRAQQVFYSAFYGLGIEAGKVTNFSDAEMLGAYKIENINGAYPDANNWYPVLYSHAGSGSIVYKFTAPDKKEFDKLYLNLAGRTFGHNDLGHTSLKVTYGFDEQEINNSVADFSSMGTPLNFGETKNYTLDVNGEKDIFVKIAFNGGPGQTWSCLSLMEVLADYEDQTFIYAVEAGNEYISNIPISGGTVRLKADVKHKSENEKYILIGAIYNKDTKELIETKSFMPESINNSEITSYCVQFNLAENDNVKYFIKGFLWDAYGSARPITPAITLK